MFKLKKVRFKSTQSRNAALNNLNGVFQYISINMVASFAGLFIKRLNASDNLVSMLNSLPAFFSVVAIIIGTRFASNCKNKKKIASLLFLTARSFYLLMAFITLINEKYRALFFVFLYSSLNFPGSIANFMWQSFFADTFKPSDRGKYLSIRNTLSTAAGTITTLSAGIILSKYAKGENFLRYYQIAFVTAFIFGILEVITLYLHKENKNNSFTEVSTGDNPLSFKFLKTMLKQKKYVYFMIGVIAFHFSWQMGWPLFLTYEVDVLHTNELWSGIITTINGIFMAIGYTYWRKFTEKNGNTLGLALGAVGMAFNPILYIFARNMRHVAYFTGIIGFSQSAVLLMLLNILYEISPRENRTTYIAFYNLATNLTLIVAPWVGMKIYKLIDFKDSFVLIAALRLASSLLFIKKPKNLSEDPSVCINVTK